MLFKLFIGSILMLSTATSLPALFYSQPTLLVETAREFNSIPCIQESANNYLQTAEKMVNSSRWIFVRHGQSLSNINKGMAGRLPEHDVDLSADGRGQANALAEKLKAISFSFDQAFSSPSKRALQTFACLKEELSPDMEVSIDEALYERWFGSYEGATENEYAPIKRKEEMEIPLLKTFTEKFAFKADPEMESLEEVNRRASDFILKYHATGKTNLVITHNAVMKALFMAAIAQQGYDIEYHDFDLGNCSVIVLEANNIGEISIKAVEGLKFRQRYSSFLAMRHEKTAQNEQGNWNIPDTSPLSEKGEQGADKLAQDIFVKQMTFDFAVTSATTRAMQTMDRVLQLCSPKIDIKQDLELAEIKMSYENDVKEDEFIGEAEFLAHGKNSIKEQIQQSGSDATEHLQQLWQLLQENKLTSNDLFKYAFDGAETYSDYSRRFLQAFHSHLTMGERTAFCVHSTGMKAILSQLKPENEIFDSISKAKAAPGSWIRGRVYRDGTILLTDSLGITIP